jgi:hypothetical protein
VRDASRLLGISPRYAHSVASSGESPRYCGANRISGTHQQGHSALPAFAHRRILTYVLKLHLAIS